MQKIPLSSVDQLSNRWGPPLHKGRNILAHLPEAQRPWVKAVLTRAYTNSPVKTAKRLLQDLARRLDTDYPSAATSVREGLDETLTVLGLGLSERLQRSALLHGAARQAGQGGLRSRS